MKLRVALLLAVVCAVVPSTLCAQAVFDDDFEWGTTCAWSVAMPAADCSMAWVPAGVFTMGTDTGQGDEAPEHPVYLNAFFVDWTEVTQAEYATCVATGPCTAPDTDSHCNWGVAGRDDHPVNCVDWYQASDYCAWVGKRLPTEAEWERAARGVDARTYPWGEEPASCDYAVMHDATGWGCGADGTWPVASKPLGRSPVGAWDMAGNVQEWVADWYDATYYAISPTSNPTGPATGTRKVQRGGAWDNPPDSTIPFFETTDRNSEEPDISKYASDGFRCARSTVD